MIWLQNMVLLVKRYIRLDVVDIVVLIHIAFNKLLSFNLLPVGSDTHCTSDVPCKRKSSIYMITEIL